MRGKRALILASIALSAAPAVVAADDPGVASGLARNAWYWQARARADKAEDAWKQVLEAAPDDPEALAAVGGFHARAGRLQQAREFLARLEKVSPGHADVPVLRRQIELGPKFAAQLAQARKLVHEGKKDDAAARYRELFGDEGPPGDLALEYFQSIGGTPGGWDQARDGLRRVIRRAPAEPRFRLALGRLLTYREASRREGIELLASLARDPTVGKEATASWRQALLWLPPAAEDIPLLRAYARLHPADAEIARRIERGRAAGTVKQGYAALDRGDLREAERSFRAAGSDPDARRGLGIVAQRRASQARLSGYAALERGDLRRADELFLSAGDDADARLGRSLVAQRQAVEALQKEDFGRAQELLERARELAPQRRDLWEQPLRSATFWKLMQDARKAQEGGRSQEAESKLLDAAGNAPERDRWQADLALADHYLATGQPRKAEVRYRDVLVAAPGQSDALRALAGLLVQEGRFDEAVPVNDTLLRVDARKAFRPEWLRAEILRARAARSVAAHDLPRARSLLEGARQVDPQGPWVLHDLANILIEQGAVSDAQPIVAELRRVAPALPEGLVVEARLLAAQRQDEKALAILSRLDPQPRDPKVLALRRRLEVQVRIPSLLAAADTGARLAALQGLLALQQQVEDAPELAAQVAVAWSKLGERQRAVGLMRSAMARAPAATRGARLELASTLLEAGDDGAVAQLLAGLELDPSLLPQERRSLGELRVAHAVRLADRDREQGQLRAAAAALDPVLRDYPRDPRLLAAFGRVLERDDPARSHGVFLTAHALAPDDLEALRGAVDTALALHDLDEAKTLADEATRRNPQDPRAHLLAGRVATVQRDDARAMRSLQRALALATPADPWLDPGSSTAALPEGARRLASYSASSADPGLRSQIAQEMQRVRDRHRPSLAGRVDARRREGEAGLSALNELRESFEAQVPLGYGGRLLLEIAEIELDGGTAGSYAAERFGTGGDGALLPQQRMGTELHATYQSRYVVADVGSTPLGFPVRALLGGLLLRDSFGPVSVSAQGGRRSIVESIVSYSGARDPTTGRIWGGVVAEGGRLDVSADLGRTGLYAYGGYDRLVGVDVAQNRRVSTGAGMQVTAYDGGLGVIRAGPAAAALAFDRNLRFFTYGQGGYFSPQQFIHGGLLLSWRRDGKVRWEAAAEPGYDAFREDSSPVFPLGVPGGTTTGTPYPARKSWGPSFNGRLLLGWAISDSVETALTFAVQRGPEFQEMRAGLVFRFGGIRR